MGNGGRNMGKVAEIRGTFLVFFYLNRQFYLELDIVVMIIFM